MILKELMTHERVTTEKYCIDADSVRLGNLATPHEF